MPWMPPRARTAAMPSLSMNPKQSQRKLPAAVWTTSARCPMPTVGSAPIPVSPGSRSRTSTRWPSPRSPVRVTQRCPPGGTYCRSSSQFAQCDGGSSLSACCTPHVRQIGDSYDESSAAAEEYCAQKQGIFVHPFDDLQTIAGQGTVGKEIFDATAGDVGMVIVPIGGGGLASGVASYIKGKNPAVVVVGAEPAGSPSMYVSLKQGRIVEFEASK